LLTFAFVTVLPFVWMVSTSFKPASLVFEMPPEFIPREPTLNNFGRVFRYENGVVIGWFLNSAIIAGVVTLSSMLVNTWAGYALAKMNFPGRRVLFWAILITMMIPGQVTLIPLYRLVLNLNWLDTYFAFIVPGIGQAFGIFLMKQYMQTLPSSLIDAARIDACSEWHIFWRIVRPLAMPGIAVVGIFVFMGNWNSFLWPVVVSQSRELTTIQVGLTLVRFPGFQGGQVDYSILMAGSLLAALPMIVVFALFQRFFLSGLTIGALKG
jgi:multiple sugar transport system permease protein